MGTMLRVDTAPTMPHMDGASPIKPMRRMVGRAKKYAVDFFKERKFNFYIHPSRKIFHNQEFMESITLDAIDLQLLDLLQHDAAKATRPWPNRCMCRPHLPAARETAARCGPDRAAGGLAAADRLAAVQGHGLACIVEVSLTARAPEALDAFEVRAVADAEVQQCWRVSPGRTLCWWCTRAIYQALALSQRLFTADANVRNVKAFSAPNGQNLKQSALALNP